MASVEKRIRDDGKASYRVKVRLKGFPPQTETFERLTDARKWAQSTEAAIREGRHFKTTQAKRHTLGETIDKYIAGYLPRLRDGKRRKQHLDWWKKQAGEYTLADIDPKLIADCRDKLGDEPLKGNPKKTKGPATQVRYLASLSNVFTYAVKELGWLESNPVLKVVRPKEPRGRIRFLDDAERSRLLKACKESLNPDLYCAVVLSLATGARKMEIMGLHWSQVDLKRHVIILHETKNDERRALPLAALALELMSERAKVRRIDTDLVFPSRKPQRPAGLRLPWEEALKEAKIENFRWHDLRHSAASYLAMSGASLAEIAEILGHKTLQMVKRYAHLSEQHTASVVSKMNKDIFG